MPLHNEDLAAAFDEMADLLALKAENQFRVNAYRRASQVVRALPVELQSKIAEGFDPDELPGIGADLAEKIRVFVQTGELPGLASLRRSVPPGLREIMSVQNIGPKRVRALYEALGVHDLKTLRAALAQHLVRQVRGFGARTEDRLAKALDEIEGRSRRLLRSTAMQYATALETYFRAIPGVTKVDIAGSFRRGRDTVGDLDVLVCSPGAVDIGTALLNYDETASVLAKGPTRSAAVLKSGLQVDVRLVPPESYGAALYYFTGSKAHNIHVRRLAIARGVKINEYGVFRGRKRIAGDTEESVFDTIGLPYIEPELREDRGEIEAAQVHALPNLVSRPDLRGDLHVHTKTTDGTATLAAMAAAAKDAGLEYIAITDHSKHLGVVRGLDPTHLARQLDEIDEVNALLEGITLLKGVEVDILEDGSLALSDAVLKKLDIVVACVHDHFDLSRRKQTERLLRALDRPYVSVLGHPTSRLIEERPAIDCDWDQVFRRAQERPIYLELNCQPNRLDLDDVLIRAATAGDVLISIASDAHSTMSFEFLNGGILQARRGWLAKDQVINTRSLRDVRRLLRKTFLG
ncbi:MAG TPA: DNA polymerase/3'-5' exonuclease PolX [Steroidobacteraceae bacterium]|nr:DNA polymerase/3'-5' exonuclease PolX [Steroidobacteraceae bacterium]